MDWNYFRIMAISSLMNFFLLLTMVNAQCVSNQEIALGQVYYIYNPQYPNFYPGSTNCSWYAESPRGTQIYLSCEEINIPWSQNCYSDRLLVSLTGNVHFTDAQTYCGSGTLSLLSQSNRLSIALIASYYSNGGRFMCSVTALTTTTSSTQRPDSCDCGWFHEKRIVGGVETAVHEFPYMAALYHVPRGSIYCGATIISDRFLLTAAHCLISSETKNLIVVVGDHDLSKSTDTDVTAGYEIQDFATHPNYNQNLKLNDIAIIQTAKKIIFSREVGPVCLPFKYSSYDFSGQIATLAGWGQLEYGGPTSDTLQKVDVQVTTFDDCARNLTNEVISRSQICTYTPNKDGCQFDSGGPALWRDYDTSRYHLVGVISYGSFCASYSPSVNTRVTSFLQWIVELTVDAQYCIR